MARNENENVDHLVLPDPEVLKVSLVMEKGESITEEDFEKQVYNAKAQKKKQPTICGKIMYNTNTRLSSYYILIAGSQMFDPTNTDIRYKTRTIWKYRRVKKTTFNLYIQFLKSRHKTYLYQAERNI